MTVSMYTSHFGRWQGGRIGGEITVYVELISPNVGKIM